MLTSIIEHTAEVQPGACFVARVRAGSDGHPYIAQAVAQGAALILGQRQVADVASSLGQTPYLQVPDSALTEAWLAAAWHDFPSRQLTITGITGTDGKTTTANILFEILLQAGLPVGLLSTLRAVVGQEEEALALHVTTPEAPVVQGYLRRMVEAGLSHCVLEVTSHGLAQERVGAVDFDLAVVTNITHEHLDYHGDYQGYLAAKAKLFQGLGAWKGSPAGQSHLKRHLSKTAVFNRDDKSFSYLQEIEVPEKLTYGLEQPAGVTAKNIRIHPETTYFELSLPGKKPMAIKTPLVGVFNLYNLLAAAAAAFALGINDRAIQAGLEAVPHLTGRLQRIDRGQFFQVVVDFAHTPNALSQAIAAARSITSGQVITVFGSAGKRDVEKRRLMAEISAREADLTVLTAEDPRTEALADILHMMADGCLRQGGRERLTFWRVPDRGRAIYFALGLAQPGDVVLICGKGHEQSMCFGTSEYPWDDIQVSETALSAFLAGRPMPDTGLPTYKYEGP
jgi:UDP-N-acetylmuramoyl-L-alanyl-D-glutamate--2,6-diaminopimelate ligase